MRLPSDAIALDVLLAVRTTMIEEAVDLVAGDFNGASGRRKVGDEQKTDSVVTKRTATAFLTLAPHRCGAHVEFRMHRPTCVALSSTLTRQMNG